jgi:hypothetical protein
MTNVMLAAIALTVAGLAGAAFAQDDDAARRAAEQQMLSIMQHEQEIIRAQIPIVEQPAPPAVRHLHHKRRRETRASR